MRFIYAVVALSAVAFYSCNNAQSTTGSTSSGDSLGKHPAAIAKVHAQSKLSDGGTYALMTVVGKYYALKNGLVATKAGRTDSAAAELTIAVDSLQSQLQKEGEAATSLKPYVDTILMESQQIAGEKDESCERQRLAFGPLSSAMFGLLKSVNLQHSGVYREYCPMAFNSKGAFWLSDESEIKNPYFGKNMLECGEVTDSL